MARKNSVTNEPVTALFSMSVKPGKEEVFKALMHDVHKVARAFPGHMGVTTLKNPSRKGSFQVILRFDNAKHLEGWINSPIRKKLMQPIAAIADSDSPTKATGLETWFDIPGQQVI